MRADVVVGTRPEIIKMAPVYFALRKARVSAALVHSGQHYDYKMSQVFFEELGLPEPESFLGIGSGAPARQTGEAMIGFDKEFSRERPDCVLVEGDTNTVLAGALAAVKRGIKVGHVEAGLRSYDLRMPEETNRRLTDHASDLLFAPTAESVAILKKERVWGKVFKTGNTVIDATIRYLPVALKKSEVLSRIPWDEFALATMHRAENVDDPETLRGMVSALLKSPIPIVLPLHPRTEARLKSTGLMDAVRSSENIALLPPAGYFDMLTLMKRSSIILTDSGGIQEEATSPVLKKRVLVTRLSTERPEAVEAGYCKVVGTGAQSILRELRAFMRDPGMKPKPCPYGRGDSGERIAVILKREV